jgi:hypothetical protein
MNGQTCTGCGSTKTIEEIRAEHPAALSCCPERRMINLAAAPDMYEALKALVAQILDYEKVNNLSPNPGRKYCWDNTERAVAAIARAEGATSEMTEQRGS